MPLDSSWTPSIYEPEWKIAYIKHQIKLIDEYLTGEKISILNKENLLYCRKIWEERLAEYDNRS